MLNKLGWKTTALGFLLSFLKLSLDFYDLGDITLSQLLTDIEPFILGFVIDNDLFKS